MKRIYNYLLRKTLMVPDQSQRAIMSRVLSTSTWGLLAFTAMGSLGIDTTPAMTTLGITGATLGFACKDLGSNVVAGIAMLWQGQFRTGDIISVGSGSAATTGQVHHWDMRYLYLRGSKGELIHIPNSVVFTTVVTIQNPRPENFAEDAPQSTSTSCPTPAPNNPPVVPKSTK